MTRISGEPYTDIMACGVPSRVNICVSQVDAVPKTNEGRILGPRDVGLNGLSERRPSRYKVRNASTRRMCVKMGTFVNAPSGTAKNLSQYPMLVPNALSNAILSCPIKVQSSSILSNRLFLFLYTLKMVNNVCS